MSRKEKIIGWVNRVGEFNGNKYDNIVLVVVLEENGIPVSADCKNYKFKRDNCKDVLGFEYDSETLDSLAGQYIKQPYFNKYGCLIGVDYE